MAPEYCSIYILTQASDETSKHGFFVACSEGEEWNLFLVRFSDSLLHPTKCCKLNKAPSVLLQCSSCFDHSSVLKWMLAKKLLLWRLMLRSVCTDNGASHLGVQKSLNWPKSIAFALQKSFLINDKKEDFVLTFSLCKKNIFWSNDLSQDDPRADTNYWV